MARVLWRDAQGIEGAVDLGAAEVRIGRAMDCAIRTDDAMVSRHHARLFWGGQGFLLEDLGSANGVYYQEQRVQSHLLKHGDAVRCGSLWLRYVDPNQPAMPEPPPPPPPPPPPTPIHNVAVPPPQPPPNVPVNVPPANSGGTPANNAAADEEIKRLKRRVDQLQAELRMVRGGKMGQDKARKLEDIESELESLTEERNQLKKKVAELEEAAKKEAGSAKVQQAVSIRSKAAEIVTALNDALSSLRIEVMAAEGEFEQYSHSIPRASFELIRQSLRDSASNVDQARELLRQLRDIAAS